MDEILDDKIEIQRKKVKNPLLRWLSIIILWGLFLLFGVDGIMADPKIIIGVVLLIACTFLMYYKPVLGAQISMGVILLGVFELINFSLILSVMNFRIGPLIIEFNILIILVGILHFFTNKSAFISLFNIVSSKIEAKRQLEFNQGLNAFKKKYENKSNEALEEILSNPHFAPEAQKAARELLDERTACNS